MPEKLAPELVDLLQQLCERAFGAGASVSQGFVFRLQIEESTDRAELSQPHVPVEPGWMLNTTRAQLSALEAGGYFERAPHGVRQAGLSVARAGLTVRAREWFESRPRLAQT
jgi:hypothetical protein